MIIRTNKIEVRSEPGHGICLYDVATVQISHEIIIVPKIYRANRVSLKVQNAWIASVLQCRSRISTTANVRRRLVILHREFGIGVQREGVRYDI